MKKTIIPYTLQKLSFQNENIVQLRIVNYLRNAGFEILKKEFLKYNSDNSRIDRKMRSNELEHSKPRFRTRNSIFDAPILVIREVYLRYKSVKGLFFLLCLLSSQTLFAESEIENVEKAKRSRFYIGFGVGAGFPLEMKYVNEKHDPFSSENGMQTPYSKKRNSCNFLLTSTLGFKLNDTGAVEFEVSHFNLEEKVKSQIKIDVRAIADIEPAFFVSDNLKPKITGLINNVKGALSNFSNKTKREFETIGPSFSLKYVMWPSYIEKKFSPVRFGISLGGFFGFGQCILSSKISFKGRDKLIDAIHKVADFYRDIKDNIDAVIVANNLNMIASYFSNDLYENSKFFNHQLKGRVSIYGPTIGLITEYPLSDFSTVYISGNYKYSFGSINWKKNDEDVFKEMLENTKRKTSFTSHAFSVL